MIQVSSVLYQQMLELRHGLLPCVISGCSGEGVAGVAACSPACPPASLLVCGLSVYSRTNGGTALEAGAVKALLSQSEHWPHTPEHNETVHSLALTRNRAMDGERMREGVERGGGRSP